MSHMRQAVVTGAVAFPICQAAIAGVQDQRLTRVRSGEIAVRAEFAPTEPGGTGACVLATIQRPRLDGAGS
jgi:hypothetical protein